MPNETGNKLVNLEDLREAFIDAKKIATQNAAGLLSATDKAKLDGIAAGAQVNTVTSVNNQTGAVSITPANIGAKPTQTAVADPTAGGTAVAFIDSIIQNANGVITPTKKTVRSASQRESGLMSATDKTKLDGIAAGAQVNSLTGVKGNAESSYRTGNVNLTPANIGAVAKTGDTMTGNLTVEKAETTLIRSSDSKAGTKVELVSADSGEHGVRSQGYYNGTAFTADIKWLIYRNTAGRVIVDNNISAPYIRLTDSDASNNSGIFNKLSTITIWDCALIHSTPATSKKLSNDKITFSANGYVIRESTNVFKFVLTESTGGTQWAFGATINSNGSTPNTIYKYGGTAM